MSHGREQEIPDNNRLDLSWLDCEDCKKADGFLCGKCYASYQEECEK